jgi:hypothetical protein
MLAVALAASISAAACRSQDQAPAPVVAATRAAPAVAKAELPPIPEVVYLQGYARLDARLEANLQCSMGVSRRRGVGHADFGPMAERVDVEQMHDVARKVAPEELAFHESLGKSQSRVDRVNRYFLALAGTAMVEDYDRYQRLVAKTWLAYFQGLPADGECPLDPDLLTLIDKKP